MAAVVRPVARRGRPWKTIDSDTSGNVDLYILKLGQSEELLRRPLSPENANIVITIKIIYIHIQKEFKRRQASRTNDVS